jgi:hypothetical protein
MLHVLLCWQHDGVLLLHEALLLLLPVHVRMWGVHGL